MPGFADLDEEFTKTTGKIKKAELPDGEYVVTIAKCVMKEPNGSPVFSFTFEFNDGSMDGAELDHDYWLKQQDGSINDRNVSQLKADLKTLGMDLDKYREEGEHKATACLKLVTNVAPGMCVKVKKTTKESNGKTYHNFYINSRSPDPKPATFTFDELAAAAADAAPADPF